ncbi:TadE/TadG family type IV pilus assembly protein [Acetivibrio cellulolyticus]|uniref:TadE/TadG family type IV pilus assembly protein n=1 Tax=Acetivibrio cellulolyticus TaxID=35830 RepID=UPI0001E2D50F|nr:TadE/TadG family type IV pilus assembly protein [Acetivibrio cellulolyticus]
MCNLRTNKGSMTVEASLIFPLIFLIIIGLIYITIFLYEQAYVKSLADRAAERGAAIWKNPKSDMYIGLVKLEDFEENDPYWRLDDDNKGPKEDKIETYIENSLKKYSILYNRDAKGYMNGADITVRAEVKNYVVYKKLSVIVKKKFDLPIGNALSIFGIDNTVEISAKSEALINEPAEFIRSTDFAIDVGKRVDDATGNRFEKIKDKVISFRRGIEDKFSSDSK